MSLASTLKDLNSGGRGCLPYTYGIEGRLRRRPSLLRFSPVPAQEEMDPAEADARWAYSGPHWSLDVVV